jgi:hypothetical protein
MGDIEVTQYNDVPIKKQQKDILLDESCVPKLLVHIFLVPPTCFPVATPCISSQPVSKT